MKTKIYYTLDQLIKDLPTLKNTEITICSDFEKTISLNTYSYKSLKEQIKKRNIKIKIEDKEDKSNE